MSETNKNPSEITGDSGRVYPENRGTYEIFMDELHDYAAGYTDLPDSVCQELIQIVRKSQDKIEVGYAREVLMRSVFRLIPWAIGRSAPTYIPPEELIGEGFEVVSRCIENYRPTVFAKTGKIIKFSTYVSRSLLRNFQGPRTFADPYRPINWPKDVYHWLNIRDEVLTEAACETGIEPDDAQLIHRINELSVTRGGPNITLERLRMLVQLKSAEFVSIDKDSDVQPNGEDLYDESSGKLEIADPDGDIEATADFLELQREIRSSLGKMPPREARVLGLWFGLTEDQPRTIAELAKRIPSVKMDDTHVSTERARQIFEIALMRLRASREIQNTLRDFLDVDATKQDT